jgi:hypothetical protein
MEFKPYTVVMLLGDDTPYSVEVDALDEDHAALVGELYGINEGEDPERLIAVFEGHHKPSFDGRLAGECDEWSAIYMAIDTLIPEWASYISCSASGRVIAWQDRPVDQGKGFFDEWDHVSDIAPEVIGKSLLICTLPGYAYCDRRWRHSLRAITHTERRPTFGLHAPGPVAKTVLDLSDRYERLIVLQDTTPIIRDILKDEESPCIDAIAVVVINGFAAKNQIIADHDALLFLIRDVMYALADANS